MDRITYDEAMYLFLLPRNLGATADGEPIDTNIGRFGPYVKYGAKYASLKEDDPYTITLERALEVIAAKQLADANRLITDFGVDNIQVLNGRYGPYITDKERNARMPKDRDPKTRTLEECRALLAAAPQRFGRGRFGKNAKGAKGATAKGKAAGKAKGKSAATADAVADGAGASADAGATTVTTVTAGNGRAGATAAAKAAAKPKAKAKSKAKAAAKAAGKAAPARGKPAGGSAAKD
jgi:DNA topoisomerase-1